MRMSKARPTRSRSRSQRSSPGVTSRPVALSSVAGSFFSNEKSNVRSPPRPAACLTRAAVQAAWVRGEGCPWRPTPRNAPPAHEKRCARSGAVGPASPSGHHVEAPVAALVLLLARRELPKSRPAAGAMLISPVLFIFSGSRLPTRDHLTISCLSDRWRIRP